MILFYIRKTLYIENAFHRNSVLRSLLLTSMWHFSVVRLFVKACRGGRKGGSFLQLYNITGICAFILCEVHYSTLFSVSTHREGKPTTVLRSKKEVTFGQQNIRLSFLWNSARRGFALFFCVCLKCLLVHLWQILDGYLCYFIVVSGLLNTCKQQVPLFHRSGKKGIKIPSYRVLFIFHVERQQNRKFRVCLVCGEKTPVWQQHISVKTIIHV